MKNLFQRISNQKMLDFFGKFVIISFRKNVLKIIRKNSIFVRKKKFEIIIKNQLWPKKVC
jgi:hypothetical protein